MEQVNIFIAFMLPKDKNEEFGRIAESVKNIFHPDSKDEKYFHTTLLFIGRVDETWLPFIEERLKKIADDTSEIHVDINRINYFYNQKKQSVKVIYAVPELIPDELTDLTTRLYNDIGKPLSEETPQTIFPAKIHFTISNRLKNKLSKEEFAAYAEKVEPFNISANINEIGLYCCKDPEHRYYRELCKFPFKKQQP